MKKTFLILTGIFLTLTKLQAEVIDRQMPITTFDALKLRVPGKLLLTEGKGVKLLIRGESEVIKHIQATVKNREIDIFTNKSRLPNIHDVEYHLTFEMLKRLYLFGQCKLISTTPIKEDDFYLVVSGSTQAQLDLQVNQFTVNVSGSAAMEVSGKAKYQNVHIAGNGKYLGFNLVGEEGDVSISGSGYVEINVTDILGVKISGAGKVRYKGTPTITQNIRGAGSLEGS